MRLLENSSSRQLRLVCGVRGCEHRRYLECIGCLSVKKILAKRRKWWDDYYYMLEKEFGQERTRLVAESMSCVSASNFWVYNTSRDF